MDKFKAIHVRKRLTALQEKRIEEAKKTFGRTEFVSAEEIARLRFSSDFPTNVPRLCKDLTEKAEIAMRDIVTLMQLMPETYTARLLTSGDFDTFIYRVMQHMESADKKKPIVKGKPEAKTEAPADALQADLEYTTHTFKLAAAMLNYSLAAIIRSMPDEFQESLKQQIYQFLILVNAIANFSQSSRARKKSPRLYLPFDLSPSYPSKNYGTFG